NLRKKGRNDAKNIVLRQRRTDWFRGTPLAPLGHGSRLHASRLGENPESNGMDGAGSNHARNSSSVGGDLRVWWWTGFDRWPSHSTWLSRDNQRHGRGPRHGPFETWA